jgi:hypothetical protein
MRFFSCFLSTVACVTLMSGTGFAAPRDSVRTVRTVKVAAVTPMRVREDRSRLFASDNGLEVTGSLAGAGAPRHGCGTIACRSYTIMGVGF